MKKILVFLLLVFSLFIAGCSTKKEPLIIVEQELVCFELNKLDRTQKIEVRVHKDDRDLFKARLDEIEEVIDIYEFQIDNYNQVCNSLQGEKI